MATKQHIYYGNATNKQREYIESRIRQEILCCQSTLVDDLLREEHDGFTIDDMENVYPDPSDWTMEQCREYLDEHGIGHPDPDPWGKETGRDQLVELLTDAGIQCYDHEDTDTLQAAVIANMDDETIDGLDDWRDAVQDNAEPNEAYGWYAVTSWLCGELRSMGEIVIDNGYGYWWGRGCSGQSVSLDPTFWTIFQDALQND